MPRGAGSIPPARFEVLLRAAGLEWEAREYASFLPSVTPLDLLLPRLTARAGARLEGSGQGYGRLLATQIVFVARKRSAAGLAAGMTETHELRPGAAAR